MIKLSVIMAYYNNPVLVRPILKELTRQATDEVEIIVVDDGDGFKGLEDYNVKLIRLPENTGGDSVPRNVGLDVAKGKFITFVDSDDMVSPDYIKTILNKINTEEFDYCYFSWKGQINTVIIKDEPPQWNCCVWDCVYSRALIGEARFKPELRLAEDLEWNRRVKRGKKAIIPKILYYYNQENPTSLTKLGVRENDKYL